MSTELGHLQIELEIYLRSMESFLGGLRQESRDRYRSYEGLVWQTGRVWTSAPLPSDVERGPRRYCYANVVQLTAQRPDLLYVEGYAIPVIDNWEGMPVQHAWAATADGLVVDPTWPEPERSAYFGRAFSRKDVARFIEISEDTFGILPTEYLLGFPLLKTGRLFPESGDGD